MSPYKMESVRNEGFPDVWVQRVSVRDNTCRHRLSVGVSRYQDAYKTMAASGKVAPYIAPDGRAWHELEASHAHSLVLMILACTGTVGLLVFGWLFLSVVRIAFTRSGLDWRSGLVVWPVVFLVNGLTGWSFFADWYHAWFAYLVALTWVAASTDRPCADSASTA